MAHRAEGAGSILDDIRKSLAELGGLEPRIKQAVAWSFVYFFAVLSSYYIIRPLRDEMGVTVGSGGLERLFTIVFLVMLAAVPLFGWLTSVFPRRAVVPIAYGFFIANLGGFWLLLTHFPASPGVAATFFVWVSVFNLFIVSLFWIAMADIWTAERAKKLYGFIAAGGSAGALVGPIITQSLVKILGAANLLLVAAMFLATATVCAIRLRHLIGSGNVGASDDAKPAGGGLLAGAAHVATSPYLLKIALWVLVANLISTFFYFEQARIVGQAIPDRADRVQLFARMDLAVSTLTIVGQLLVTGAVIRRAGVGLAVAALPLSALAALTALGLWPTLAVVVAVIVLERAIGFAITNPAARVLYTVVDPEEKYKSQNFIDTVVFRGGDALSGWIFNSGAKALGLGTGLIALLAIPFALAWIGLSLALGREQVRRQEAQERLLAGTARR